MSTLHAGPSSGRAIRTLPAGATVAPLSHASRGPHAGDAKRFGLPQLARLREAAHDVGWLVDRSYPRESTVRFVGDHYQLAARQRLALFRGAVSDGEQRRRAAREERGEHVRGQTLLIDGLNLVITLEVALAGGPLLACADGTIRHLAGLQRGSSPCDGAHDRHRICIAMPRLAVSLRRDQPSGNLVRVGAPETEEPILLPSNVAEGPVSVVSRKEDRR